ncbi:unnamed protein product [Trichobilharzia szidati]|nr:unnamed protein product [Trichobilharzia szidati]
MCTKAQECVVKYQYSASKASTWGILKKMSYASISGSVAIVLCFPNSAFSAATNLWHIESKKMTEIKKRFSD